MAEINRAVKFGFTKSEINRAVITYKSRYENQIAKLDDRAHRKIINLIRANYLDNVPLTDLTEKYEIAKPVLNNITQDDLLKQIQKLYTANNRSVIVTGVEGKNNLSETEVIQIIDAIENDESLQPYQEEKEVKPLMTGVKIKPGNIEATEKNKSLGFTTYTLSNGIRVHYQFVDKDKNKVSLSGHSYGGTSLLAIDDLPSASVMNNVMQMSGLGEFSATELPKVLAGKTATVRLSLDDITESIYGSSTTKDVETMLQLLNLHFTKPRFDESAYKVFLQKLDNYLIFKGQDLRSKMDDSLNMTLYGNNPRKRVFNKAYIDDISFEKIKDIYTTRYADASDFQFFIVGDTEENVLKPLLEQYVASIPTTNSKTENYKDNSVEWLNPSIDKDIYVPMEDLKTSVRMAFKKEIPYSIKNSLLMKALGSILQLRYLESLREEEGGTYGASARGFLVKEPKPLASLSINFDCNPDLAEKLISIVYKEIETIKTGNVKQDDLDKVLASLIKEREICWKTINLMK